MASLEYGQQTEEEVCQAIEAKVCEGLSNDKEKLLDANSQLRQHFEDLGKHYASLADYDSLHEFDDEDNYDTNTKNKNDKRNNC